MADLSQHTNYTAAYSGLLDNFYLTLGIAGVCLVGYEIEAHVPRRRGKDGHFQRVPVRVWHALRGRWKRWRGKKAGEGPRREDGRLSSEGLVSPGKLEIDAREKLGSREAWEFAYIYQPKAWTLDPKRSAPLPRWPLAWIATALKVKESEMPEKCGLDITLHMRFLRGAFFYTLLQTLVLMPILMPLHIIYSPSTIARTSMLRASISSLVQSSGSKWLWVHALLIWWISITWGATVLWITWGAVAYRRREVRTLGKRVRARREGKTEGEGGVAGGMGGVGVGEGQGDDDKWSIGEECEGIKRFKTLMVTNVPPDMRDESVLRDYFDYFLKRHAARKASSKNPAASAGSTIAPTMGKLIKQVLPISQGEDAERAFKMGEGLESDVQEVVLVRKLGRLINLRGRREDVLRKLEVAHVNLAKRVLADVAKHKKQKRPLPWTRKDHEDMARLDELSDALGKYVLDEPWREGEKTVWEALHALPRELLDPYQSLTHMTSLFRDTNAPLIDYLTTKLSYLTMLLHEARSKPLESYPAASTAFVTFRDAKTARLALKILDNHPKRTLACRAVPAPEWTDLLWPRLGKSVYRSEFVRSWVVYLGVWAFTLVWIFPVSLLCALASLTNIAGFIKPLANFLAKNPNAASAITSLAPVILVALLTIAICPILLVIANKAETIVTRLGIHNSVLERFWKFLMVNGVVFFAIGQSAIEAYLTAFQNNSFDPLPVVASAFPTAAPYFASYILLQTAIQPFFEIFRFGLPTIVYVFGTRVSTIPRQRFSRTEHPTFSHFSQVPQQLLATAINLLFCLLNPLVIAFTLVYYGACYVVWKRQFIYVYGRLYETNGRRSSIRILRYSFDALALAQFVLFAFFILNKAKGHAIATGVLLFLTLCAKLIITRALKRRFNRLDHEEADILCPPVTTTAAVEGDADSDSSISDDEDASDPSHPSTAPAHGHGHGIPLSRGGNASAHFHTVKRNFHQWTKSWGNDPHSAAHRKPIPIPFVRDVFASLDSAIDFEAYAEGEGKGVGVGVPSAKHGELHGRGASGDTETVSGEMADVEPAPQVITPHHPYQQWEDIPPYQRARGYNDQPAYTDGFDDFLWLPRNPLSTLDLDDTVEMRLSLTTSEGGAGRIGDWPPDFENEKDELDCLDEEGEGEGGSFDAGDGEPVDPEEEEEMGYGGGDRPTPSRSKSAPEPYLPSPNSDSDAGLLPRRGAVRRKPSASLLFRRHTERTADNLVSLFRKPQSQAESQAHGSPASLGSEPGEAISMETFSRSTGAMPTTDSPDVFDQGYSGGEYGLERVSTPRPMSELEDGMPGSSRAGTGTDTGTGTGSSLEPGVHNPQSQTRPTMGTGSTSGTGSHISFPPTLGRSPSGRRPTRLNSKHSGVLLGEGLTPASAAGISMGRSPSSARSPSIGRRKSRTASGNGTATTTQAALLAEVMAEERQANKEAREEERVEQAKEDEEVMKEQGKRRKASLNYGSGPGSGDGGLLRRFTRGGSEMRGSRLNRTEEGEEGEGEDGGAELKGRKMSLLGGGRQRRFTQSTGRSMEPSTPGMTPGRQGGGDATPSRRFTQSTGRSIEAGTPGEHAAAEPMPARQATVEAAPIIAGQGTGGSHENIALQGGVKYKYSSIIGVS
ncbi:hypothetical protein IAT38_004781 [Cryptococcus sp. DSM 104549]